MPARLKVAVVREAVENLLSRRTHPAFAGYLALCEEATRVQRLDDLEPNFKNFFETYLLVEGGPNGRPYYRPFWHQQSSKLKAWYHSNVAGSFSPRSASRIAAFTACVAVDSERGLFSLRPEHAKFALEHLAYGNAIEVTDLAVYLFRDFEFEENVVAASDLVEEVAARFTFGSLDELQPLYHVPLNLDELTDLFEIVDGGSSS